ncbi:MAG: hypothetical protein JO279_08555 [Verrucomicrobia bacterium]|nr:hypothetical protein [Verrucomicrobiota bacterium]
MRLILVVLICAVPIWASGNQTLASKVSRVPLDRNEPAVVRVGTRGITTLEFPYRIEALDGYGFSVSPSPDGADLFQISFNKGTNFLSLKAMHEGVEGNLTVVLDGKVYCLFCTAVADPSFVVLFEDGAAKTMSDPHDVLAKAKQVSPSRLLGFLDKVKGYPALKLSAPEIFRNMEVAEPNSESSLDGLKLILRRVIRDESLDSLGIEVELTNLSDKDFLYDPESFAVRVGDEVYPEAVCDAGGIVEAGKTLPAFFVVAGTATGDRNDLAVTNKFDIVVRKILDAGDTKLVPRWKEPPDSIPTAQGTSHEPAPPAQTDGVRVQTKGRVATEGKKSRKQHRHRRNSELAIKENDAVQPNKATSGSKMAAQADEE